MSKIAKSKCLVGREHYKRGTGEFILQMIPAQMLGLHPEGGWAPPHQNFPSNKQKKQRRSFTNFLSITYDPTQIHPGKEHITSTTSRPEVSDVKGCICVQACQQSVRQ